MNAFSIFKKTCWWGVILLLSCNTVENIKPKSDPIAPRTNYTCFSISPSSFTNDNMRLGYTYLKRVDGFADPLDLLPSPFKENMEDRLEWIESNYFLYTVEASLNEMVQDGHITQYVMDWLLEFWDHLVVPEDLHETLEWLIDAIPEVETDEEVDCISQYHVLAVFKSYRYILQFYDEVATERGYLSGGDQILPRNGCNFWDQLGCTLNGETLLWALGGAIIGCHLDNIFSGGSDITPNSGNAGFDLSGLVIAVWCVSGGITSNIIGVGFGAVVGALFGIASQWASCACPDCDGIDYLIYRYVGCNPTAIFRPAGFGDDIVDFDWNNTNGNPATATTTRAAPALQITQTSAPLLTPEIQANCSESQYDPDLFSQDFDLISGRFIPENLGLTPGTIILLPNDDLEHTYYVFGEGWTDISRYDWSFSVTEGTIEEDNGTSVVVNWNGNEDGQICITYWVDCDGGWANRVTDCITVRFTIP